MKYLFNFERASPITLYIPLLERIESVFGCIFSYGMVTKYD